MKRILINGLAFLVIFSCVPDEGPNAPDEESNTISEVFDEEEVANLRTYIVDELTGSSSKTIFFYGATFSGSLGDMDASDLKNVKDDEFIFHKIDDSEENRFKGLLEWRPGLSIPEEANTLEELAIGTKVEPMTIEFEIGVPSEGKRTVRNEFQISFDESTLTNKAGKQIKTQKSAEEWPWKSWYVNIDPFPEVFKRSLLIHFFPPNDCDNIDTFLDPKWVVVSAETKKADYLRLCAREKQLEDYSNNLAANLMFEEEFFFYSDTVSWEADMTSSNNAIYIATSEKSYAENGIIPERIIKYDIQNGIKKESTYFNWLGLGKRAHVFGNDLWVVSWNSITKYDLDLANPPELFNVFNENQAFDRATAMINDVLYLSDSYKFVEENDGNTYWTNTGENGLYEWKVGSNSIQMIDDSDAVPVTPVAVGNRIYSLGVNRYFDVNTSEVHPLPTRLPNDVPYIRNTTASGSLIYLAGSKSTTASDNTILDENPYMAVYDTQNGAFSELSTNLNSPNKETIAGMTIVNGRIYILYGEDIFNEEVQWHVLSAPLE